MRSKSIIKYCVPLIIAFCMFMPEVHAISMSGILKENSNKGLQKFTKQEEAEYINKNNIRNNYSIKVTTKNQGKFDREGDGYLNGEELREYLEKYDKID